MKTLFAKLPHTASAMALVLGASLASAAPAAAQDTAAAVPPAVETVDVDPALWVVKDEDTTIYMFGTVHVLRPGLGWFDDGVKKAFDESDDLVLEIIEPAPEVAQPVVIKYAVDPAGKALRDKLPEGKKKAYEAALATLNIPAPAFDQFEPWFASMTLSLLPVMASGYDINSGAEKQLTNAAKAAGKPVREIENFEQQIQILDGLSETAQIEYLSAVSEGMSEIVGQLDAMVTSWGKGDVETLANLMNEDIGSNTELYEALLVKRNLNWANWVQERLKTPGTSFVAVGSAHLAGKDSVQAKLAERSIETTRINY